jgi:hypothetical protein
MAPLYPVINKNTGETKELKLTISEWEQWKTENFGNGWDRDWSQGCASSAESGEWMDTLVKKHPGWNQILDQTSRYPGSKVKPI